MAYNTRIGASVAIVRDGAILLVSFDEPGVGFHYNLPGGGLEPGESLRETARREALEEACADVEVGRLLLVWEHVRERSRQDHSVKLIFEAQLREGCVPAVPAQPDPYQIGIEWVPLDQLRKAPLLPRIAGQLRAALHDGPLDDLYLPLR